MKIIATIIGWILILYRHAEGSSYNQPRVQCPNASWDPNATTFTGGQFYTFWAIPLLINQRNTLVSANVQDKKIFTWFNGIPGVWNISMSIDFPISLFPISDDEIILSYNSTSYGYLDRLNLYSALLLSNTSTDRVCVSLFVDINDDIYCSARYLHNVGKKSWTNQTNSYTIVAGNGIAGSSPEMLFEPAGIFVTSNFDLYVADSGNDRVQLFRAGQINATTVAGNGSNGTLPIDYPMSITLDADGYLYIVSHFQHRVIVVGFGVEQCIVGCTGTQGFAANQLQFPSTLAFDTEGNLFVGDIKNDRIQKFQLISNPCIASTTTSTTTTSTTRQLCSFIQISITPGISNISHPIQIRREEDFYLSSTIQISCNSSFQLAYEWKIYNCSFTVCSTSRMTNLALVATSNEYFLPAQSLSLGSYQIEMLVMMNTTASVRSNQTQSIYLLIIPSDVTANLVPLGTSMITHSISHNLRFNPGEYTIDLDEDSFNGSEWTYNYYCRIYGVAYFPNYLGQLLTIDDLRIDPLNPSCFLNRSTVGNVSQWIYDGSSQSIKSALTILPYSFASSNQTYQFMVRMTNKHNASEQATGYVLVRVEQTAPHMIIIGCVIQTMCIPNLKYQFVNPTTQVSLYSFCFETCPTLVNITWNIYQGQTSLSSNVTQWLFLNLTQSKENIWFFGRYSKNFTSISQLFSSFPYIDFWRFEVVYSFANEQSRSTLNFRVNRPPSNGSCSISPHNGTTMTLFSVLCPNWFDEDQIQDYSLYLRSKNQSDWIFVSYSSVETFDVLFPSGDHQLIVSIRDKRNSVTEWNLTIISVQPDTNSSTSNAFYQLLSIGNPTIKSQVMNIMSQQMNQNNAEFLRNASSSNGVSLANISVSSLDDSSTISSTSTTSNFPWEKFMEMLNEHATNREYLIQILTSLQISNSNSLKLQSTTLVQLTSSTNELTRLSLALASERCLKLSQALEKMSKRIPFEDLQFITEQLSQCSANLLTAVNGPLQKRMIILKSDSDRANQLPDDYDTDLESQWSNPNLFADGNDFSSSTIEKQRNLFYQNELKQNIQDQMKELDMNLFTGLNLHLNVNQTFLSNRSSIVVSIVKLPIDSFLNKTLLEQRVSFPSQLNLSSNQSQSLRFTTERLSFHSSDQIQTNLSRMISVSILDSNGNLIKVKTNRNDPLTIFIPHDQLAPRPAMSLQNVTQIENLTLFNYHFVSLVSQENQSIHFEFESLNKNLSYFFVYRFDFLPIYNRSHQLVDDSFLFCSSKRNSSIFKFYLDNEQTFGHRSIFIGVAELNETEVEQMCSLNRTSLRDDQKRNFTSNYFLRLYQSGCFYLNDQNRWKSDGLRVGPLTNPNETQCLAEHLTSFTSSFTFLPAPIQWNRVFSQADFTRNPTIYLTIIIVLLFYISLMIYSRRFDRKDLLRSQTKMLIDNHRHDKYFYQIIVFTGQRKHAATKSNIYFVLSGDENDTDIRRLKTNDENINKYLFHNGNIDSFLLSTSKSLTPLNYLHIWHDNTGEGGLASWFLKCFIVKDLQTEEISYFITQRWLAVEKGDGKIERLIPVANDQERRAMKFRLTKQFKMKFTDDHLWFSIFSYSKSNRLTRIQRCTLCFLIFILSLLFNILYYDLSTQTSSSTFSIQLGPLVISLEQIIVGVIVELFVLIPSILFVQAFRFVQSSSSKFRYIFLYVLTFLTMLTSIFFIIARGLEFGDEKSRQWLISILTGFFSSIFVTQPLKIFAVSILIICLRRNSIKDKQIDKYLLDRTQVEYLPNRFERRFSFQRLAQNEIDFARQQRLVEIQMFMFFRRIFISIVCLILISFFLHSTNNSHSFEQVRHLKSYLTDPTNQQMNFYRMKTIDQFWFWLEKNFVVKLRAQKWYNDEKPAYLNGYLNDKVNRHIGWTMMKQYRVQSSSCSVSSLQLRCHDDYHRIREERTSFDLGWINRTETIANRSIEKAFQYQHKLINHHRMIQGEHGQYSLDYEGYLYEFRGRLNELQSNLSVLHQYQWIDRSTRAILIQMNLYNPNVQLFSSVSLLIEFLSSGSLHQQIFIDPISFGKLSSLSQWIYVILFLIILIFLLIDEVRLLMKMKGREYFCRFWSWIEWTFLWCSILSIVFYFLQYQQTQTVGQIFTETNGYSFIDFHLLTSFNRLFNIFISLSAFFSILRFLQFSQYHHRLSLFTRTLTKATNELISFSMMFFLIFTAFLLLFYFLFVSKISTCSTLFQTSRMLFEMSLLKFDAHELSNAASVLGPITFTLFIFIVVFVCLSMFVSIISDNFRLTRISIDDKDQYRIIQQMFQLIIKKFLQCIGLKNPENRAISEYYDTMEYFPKEIDRLTMIIDRVCYL